MGYELFVIAMRPASEPGSQLGQLRDFLSKASFNVKLIEIQNPLTENARSGMLWITTMTTARNRMAPLMFFSRRGAENAEKNDFFFSFAMADILRGMSEPRRCHPAREASQNSLGQAFSERPIETLSHGANGVSSALWHDATTGEPDGGKPGGKLEKWKGKQTQSAP